MDEEGIIVCCFQEFWDNSMISEKKDSKGARYGSKTSTLEMIGLILPFLLMPDCMKGRTVVLTTDNISCVFGWENKAVKGDISASILVRVLSMISVVLKCVVYVQHEKRKTSWESCLADRLTRKKTTVRQDRELLNSFKHLKIPSFFKSWMKDPREDWSLVDSCLKFLTDKE